MRNLPMEEGTDLEKASLRYILTHATWELIE